MIVAIIGSRDLWVADFEKYLPEGVEEIVSGGARGIDTAARKYAQEKGIKLKEFLPDYATHGNRAPLLRNLEIIDYSDLVLAFWDGSSRGTKFVIDQCKKRGKPCKIFLKK
ncbi:MAG: DUF2493 domain-containing protein [Clostridia bacterium]|nr:DUF2493 domain-containing protein [Clostridia bacterium]